jgi:hypothetical protein
MKKGNNPAILNAAFFWVYFLTSKKGHAPKQALPGRRRALKSQIGQTDKKHGLRA